MNLQDWKVIFLFFREYKYTREIAAAVVKHLQYRGFDAALAENLFHDNSDDGLFLESDDGRRAIVALHVEGIVNYVLKR